MEQNKLHPSMLHPRLQTTGAQIGKSLLFPNRRGVAKFFTSCNGLSRQTVAQCHSSIATFMRNNYELKADMKATFITCRVGHLETKRMVWHVHYEREDWRLIIEGNASLNIWAEDIAEPADFHRLMAIIDVYKHCYARCGWEIYEQQLVNLALSMGIGKDFDTLSLAPPTLAPSTVPPPPSTAQANHDSKEKEEEEEAVADEDHLSLLRNTMKEEGYQASKQECRLWRSMDKDKKADDVSLEKEMASVTRMAMRLKRLCNDNVFREMRFGLDFESNTTFVEVRPSAYLMIFSGKLDIKKFISQHRAVNKQRFDGTEMKLKRVYSPQKVAEIEQYAKNFFKAHPDLFDWYRQLGTEAIADDLT